MARIHARKPLTRPATNLAANINQRLLGYATAATAAGVGVLALAQPAEAKIVYTPVNIPITLNGPAVQVDLNHDGIIDFSFINFSGSGICGADKGRRHDRAKVGHPNTQILRHSLPENSGRTAGERDRYLADLQRSPVRGRIARGTYDRIG